MQDLAYPGCKATDLAIWHLSEARASQFQASSLHGVEAVWKRLDLAGLYKLLLAECSSRDRKDLSYLGGIRLSPEDAGWPAPYAAVESYDLADGSRQLTRGRLPRAHPWGGCSAAGRRPAGGQGGRPAGVPGVAPVPALRAVWPLEVRDLDRSRERAVRPLLRLGAARSSRAACFGPQDVELACTAAKVRGRCDLPYTSARGRERKKKCPQAPARLPGRRRRRGLCHAGPRAKTRSPKEVQLFDKTYP